MSAIGTKRTSRQRLRLTVIGATADKAKFWRETICPLMTQSGRNGSGLRLLARTNAVELSCQRIESLNIASKESSSANGQATGDN
jgi:hypothetical protein